MQSSYGESPAEAARRVIRSYTYLPESVYHEVAEAVLAAQRAAGIRAFALSERRAVAEYQAKRS